jgi:hypothetical protein
MVDRDAVTRRTVLKSLGATTTIAEFTELTTADTASQDDTVEIVTARSDDEPIRTKRVPRSWREHALHSRQVNDQITKNYLHRPAS